MLLQETKSFFPRWLQTRTAFPTEPITVVVSDKGLTRPHGFTAPSASNTKAWLLQMEGYRIVDQRVV
jgi:hypothetical protein